MEEQPASQRNAKANKILTRERVEKLMAITRYTTPVSSIKKEVRKGRLIKNAHAIETLRSEEAGQDIKRAPEGRSDMEQLIEKITSLQVTQRGNNGGHAMLSYKENESFFTFVRKVNDYLNYIGADETYAIGTLPIMLTSYAHDAYDKVDQELKSKGPWREIYPEDRILLAQAELASVKQNTAKVKIFAKTCKELAERAYPFDEKAREAPQGSTEYRPNYKQYWDGMNHFNNAKARGRDNSRSPREVNALNPLFTLTSPVQSRSRRIPASINAITVMLCCIIALSGIASIKAETLHGCQNAGGEILVTPPRP
uniref:HTH psq-type domain-containing protein n=1 Tax=Heterorhabditis bacteriophora TaxID=37862 RepID=A0A1I7X0F2_HETBA